MNGGRWLASAATGLLLCVFPRPARAQVGTLMAPFVAGRTSVVDGAADGSAQIGEAMEVTTTFHRSALAMRLDGDLGGGSAGFDGRLVTALAVGSLLELRGTRHALVARAGVSFVIEGNDRFFSRNLELPRGELGYRYDPKNGFVVDAGAHGGLALADAFRAAGASRAEPWGWDAGPFLWLGMTRGSWLFNLHYEGASTGKSDVARAWDELRICALYDLGTGGCVHGEVLAGAGVGRVYVVTVAVNLSFLLGSTQPD